MKFNKIILLSFLLLAILTLGAVSAANETADTLADDAADNIEIGNDADEVLTDNTNQKQDLNISIDYPDELIKEKYTKYPYYIILQNVPNDYNTDYFDVYVDNQFVRTMDRYGDNKAIDLTKLSYGNHSLLIKLNGTERYNPANITHTFTLVESIIYFPDEIVVGYGGISIRSDISASGYLIVNIDGKQFKKVALEEDYDLTYAGVDFKGVSFGTHEIEAIYTGGNGHKRNSIKKTVNVTYYMSSTIVRNYYLYGDDHITYLDCSAYAKQKTELEILLPRDVKKTPIVTIGDKNYAATRYNLNIEEAYFKADLTYAPIGSNNITITYPGDSKYPKKTITSTLDVIAKIQFPDVTYYNASEIVLRLPEDAKGNLTAYVDGKFYKTQAMVKGEAKILIDLPPKTYHSYQITASYDGTDYDVKNETEYVMVYPNIIAHEMTYGEKQTAFIEVDPDSEMNISYYKNDVLTPIKMVNGKGNFTITTDGYEYYTWEKSHLMDVVLVFDGDDYYKSIKINPLPSKLVASDITAYYGEAKTYSLKVWGPMGKVVGSGEKVKITIDSKSFYKNTNKNGIISFSVDLDVGTHKITASYQDAKTTTKVVVKQPLSLKAVTVKKSAKKLTLQATLKKGKTAMKNKQITFKFNGKTYKAKTNKNGIAKVTVPKSVLSKLKVGKTVTYQATYLKDTVKKTAKVKK